jgi:hypothetical protein
MLKNAIVLTPPRALEPYKLAVARRAAATREPVNRSAWLALEAQTGSCERAANRGARASRHLLRKPEINVINLSSPACASRMLGAFVTF